MLVLMLNVGITISIKLCIQNSLQAAVDCKRKKKLNFSKIFGVQFFFISIFDFSFKKIIQKSTNKPSIGPVESFVKFQFFDTNKEKVEIIN